MNGISMLILSVGGIIAVLFFVTYAAQRHDLNGIKDKTVGNGQHGTARWATRQEVKRTYHHVPYTPNQWRQAAKEGKQPTANGKPLPQGIILGCQGGRKTTALVDSDDVHVLMIGASGVGKTAYFLYPNLEYACASGMSWLIRRQKLRQHQDDRSEQSLRRIIEKGILSAVAVIAIGVDNGFIILLHRCFQDEISKKK